MNKPNTATRVTFAVAVAMALVGSPLAAAHAADGDSARPAPSASASVEVKKADKADETSKPEAKKSEESRKGSDEARERKESRKDVCANLAGDQESVPAGRTRKGDDCVKDDKPVHKDRKDKDRVKTPKPDKGDDKVSPAPPKKQPKPDKDRDDKPPVTDDVRPAPMPKPDKGSDDGDKDKDDKPVHKDRRDKVNDAPKKDKNKDRVKTPKPEAPKPEKKIVPAPNKAQDKVNEDKGNQTGTLYVLCDTDQGGKGHWRIMVSEDNSANNKNRFLLDTTTGISRKDAENKYDPSACAKFNDQVDPPGDDTNPPGDGDDENPPGDDEGKNDVCSNLEGVQEFPPYPYEAVGDGTCAIPEPEEPAPPVTEGTVTHKGDCKKVSGRLSGWQNVTALVQWYNTGGGKPFSSSYIAPSGGFSVEVPAGATSYAIYVYDLKGETVAAFDGGSLVCPPNNPGDGDNGGGDDKPNNPGDGDNGGGDDKPNNPGDGDNGGGGDKPNNPGDGDNGGNKPDKPGKPSKPAKPGKPGGKDGHKPNLPLDPAPRPAPMPRIDSPDVRPMPMPRIDNPSRTQPMPRADVPSNSDDAPVYKAPRAGGGSDDSSMLLPIGLAGLAGATGLVLVGIRRRGDEAA